MSNYYAKSELVQERQLKVQELALRLAITGNATPASVVIAVDDPSILFLKTEGVNKITAALNGDTAPTFVAQVDANGLFSAMIVVGEQIKKVLSAQLIRRTAHGVDTCKLADTDGITVLGDKIVLDCDTGVDLSAANLDACLIVKYEVQE
tara:strand:+ start:1331 stop:1780 length:450 start_codon:yes stop_codon:yes gene_type:complete